MSVPRASFPLLLAVACSGDKDPTTPTTDTEDTETTPSRESGTPQPSGGKAAISVLRYGADAFGAEQTVALSTFVDDDLGALNYVDCLIRGYCFTDLGVAGTDPTLTYLSAYPRFLDGGDVAVGDVTLPYDPRYQVASTGDFAWFSGAASVSTTGGEDVPAYTGGGRLDVPSLEVLSPATDTLVPMAPAQALDLTWTPGDPGELLITVYGKTGTTFFRPDDDGSTTIPANTFGFSGALDAATVVVSRVSTGGDAIDDTSDVRWWAEDARVLYLDFRNLGDIEPLAPGAWSEDCAGLSAVPPLGAGTWFVDTTASTNDVELEPKNPLTTYPTPGGEILLPIDLLPGQRLTATWRSTFGDASLYLLTDACDPATGITGSDATYANEEETVTHTATAAESVVLVLDAYDHGSPGLVEIAIE